MTVKVNAIRRIHDISDEDIQHTFQQARNSLTKSGKKIGTFKSAEIWLTGDLSNNWLCLLKDGLLLYVVKSKRRPLKGTIYGQQVMAARNFDNPPEYISYSRGFAVHAFMNICLKMYDQLVSDSLMTDHGFRIFSHAVEAAFRRRKFVYLMDKRATPIEFTRIKTIGEYDRSGPKIFNTDTGNQLRLIVISNKELL